MNIKQSSAALKSVDGFLKSRGVHLGAVSTLELVELMVVALATQPPQDERGQRLSAWQISERMPTCHRQRTSLENINDVLEVISAEPAQPVALSTLTDAQIEQIWLNARDDKNELKAAIYFARAILAASAPAQQAAPVKLTKYDRDEGGMFPSESGDWVLYEDYLEQQAITPQPVAAEVPPGMVLLPIEPTPEMIEAVRLKYPFLFDAKRFAEDWRLVVNAAAMAGTGSDESKKGEV